jgi:hypothetical protein
VVRLHSRRPTCVPVVLCNCHKVGTGALAVPRVRAMRGARHPPKTTTPAQGRGGCSACNPCREMNLPLVRWGRPQGDDPPLGRIPDAFGTTTAPLFQAPAPPALQRVQATAHTTKNEFLGGSSRPGSSVRLPFLVHFGSKSAEFGSKSGSSGSKFERLGSKFGSSGSKFAGLGSKFGSFGSKFERLGSKFGSSGSKFERLGSKFGSSGSKFERLGSKVGSFGSKFAGLGSKFGSSGSKFERLGSKFGSFGSKFEGPGSTSEESADHIYKV